MVMIAYPHRPGVFCWCTRVPVPGESAVKIAATAFVLLLSSFPLAAQNSAKPESPAIVLRAQPVGGGCPIGMVASQGVWDHTLRVRQGQEGQNPQPFGQRIFLTLNDTRSKAQ